jgi:hypothetical protein
MARRKTVAIFCLILGLATGAAWAQGKLYRWVDENGVVHFGDRVPPQYAKLDRQVLNDRGVQVDTLEGARTDDELAAEQHEADLEAAEQREADAAKERDRILISTYASVEEIEALRDRRMELVGGQIRATEVYLEDLREKLVRLQQETERFKPYSSDPNARSMPENLAREMSETLDSIILYEQTLTESRLQKDEMVARFATDIDRFRQLKGLD